MLIFIIGLLSVWTIDLAMTVWVNQSNMCHPMNIRLWDDYRERQEQVNRALWPCKFTKSLGVQQLLCISGCHPDSQEYSHHVLQILQYLLENKLFVKSEKSQFHVPSVNFFSFIIQNGQVSTDPGKFKAVPEWPKPTSCKDLQWFLEFTNFIR